MILCVCFWLFPELINGGWLLPVEEHGWMCSLTLWKNVCSQSHAWLHLTARGKQSFQILESFRSSWKSIFFYFIWSFFLSFPVWVENKGDFLFHTTKQTSVKFLFLKNLIVFMGIARKLELSKLYNSCVIRELRKKFRGIGSVLAFWLRGSLGTTQS